MHSFPPLVLVVHYLFFPILTFAIPIPNSASPSLVPINSARDDTLLALKPQLCFQSDTESRQGPDGDGTKTATPSVLTVQQSPSSTVPESSPNVIAFNPATQDATKPEGEQMKKPLEDELLALGLFASTIKKSTFHSEVTIALLSRPDEAMDAKNSPKDIVSAASQDITNFEGKLVKKPLEEKTVNPGVSKVSAQDSASRPDVTVAPLPRLEETMEAKPSSKDITFTAPSQHPMSPEGEQMQRPLKEKLIKRHIMKAPVVDQSGTYILRPGEFEIHVKGDKAAALPPKPNTAVVPYREDPVVAEKAKAKKGKKPSKKPGANPIQDAAPPQKVASEMVPYYEEPVKANPPKWKPEKSLGDGAKRPSSMKKSSSFTHDPKTFADAGTDVARPPKKSLSWSADTKPSGDAGKAIKSPSKKPIASSPSTKSKSKKPVKKVWWKRPPWKWFQKAKPVKKPWYKKPPTKWGKKEKPKTSWQKVKSFGSIGKKKKPKTSWQKVKSFSSIGKKEKPKTSWQKVKSFSSIGKKEKPKTSWQKVKSFSSIGKKPKKETWAQKNIPWAKKPNGKNRRKKYRKSSSSKSSKSS